jgi:hypothetical protein
MTGYDEDAGADDGADTKRNKMNRTQRATKLYFARLKNYRLTRHVIAP